MKASQVVEKADAILKRTAMVLLGFVMFFVFSCVMSLTPAQLAEAKAQNIAILSYLSNQHASPTTWAAALIRQQHHDASGPRPNFNQQKYQSGKRLASLAKHAPYQAD